ncbi:MAG TPA: tetratricopeptide repeat protein, partial [Elusimicrobiota bacterium]|nr:tetratricopeptide repeat protein [Elusimicrobiota bacterium]
DSYVLLYRRRWGILLFLCAILFFYSGFQNMAHQMSLEKPSDYLDLRAAYRCFWTQQYKASIARCQEILKRDKNDVHAWSLLGASWSALGRKDQARKAWEQVLRIDPEHPAGKSVLFEKKEPAHPSQ